MNRSVASSANRNYVQPMLRRISEVVMVLLCFFPANATVVKRWFSQNSIFDRDKNGISREHFFRRSCMVQPCFCAERWTVLFFIFSSALNHRLGIRLCFSICRKLFLSLRCTIVFLGLFCSTTLAKSLESIISCGVFVKFRELFIQFANATSFCYNMLRHFCSPEQDCLEPVTGYTPVTGLFYDIPKTGFCQVRKDYYVS
jgi:hypothetical protein